MNPTKNRMIARATFELNRGGIAVIPTDTLYGIAARAAHPAAVARLFRLRRRAARKPFLILIPSISALRAFCVRLTEAHRVFLKRVWPGKVSVIFRCPAKRFSYLHRGTKTLAFRFPRSVFLISLLKRTGPLAAPSANPENEKPAETICEARRYFGRHAGCYVSAGRRLSGKPSALVSFTGSTPEIIRDGSASAAVRRAISICKKSQPE